jgi:hypothetical protein
MDDSLLRKVEGSEDRPDAFVSWVEYWLGDELVHRSVHGALKGREYKFDAGAFH